MGSGLDWSEVVVFYTYKPYGRDTIHPKETRKGSMFPLALPTLNPLRRTKRLRMTVPTRRPAMRRTRVLPSPKVK